LAVGTSLKSIAITSMQDALRKEEERVETCTLALMEADDKDDDRKRKFYSEKIKFHQARVDDYMNDLKKMRLTDE
jgi:hypothetical protein